jgi:hypothetical protein
MILRDVLPATRAHAALVRTRAGAGYIGRMSRSSVASLVRPMVLMALWTIVACGDRETSQRVAQAFQAGTPAPDEVPRMLNSELPFRYPAALYARKV